MPQFYSIEEIKQAICPNLSTWLNSTFCTFPIHNKSPFNTFYYRVDQFNYHKILIKLWSAASRYILYYLQTRPLSHTQTHAVNGQHFAPNKVIRPNNRCNNISILCGARKNRKAHFMQCFYCRKTLIWMRGRKGGGQSDGSSRE